MKLFITLFFLLLVSCSNTNDNKEEQTYILTKKWALTEATNSSGDDIRESSRYKSILFNADGTFSTEDGSNSSEGLWSYSVPKIELSYSENSQEIKEVLDITEHNEDELILFNSGKGETLKFRSAEFTLNIKIDPSVSYSGEAHAYLVSNVTSGTPDYSYIFNGTKIINGKAKFNLESLPEEALNSFKVNGISQTVGVMMIVVFTGDKMPDGKIVETNEFNNRFIGAVRNIGVIYNGTKGSNEIEWLSEFRSGFSLGEGTANPDTESSHDIFVPIENKEVLILSPSEFIFPNWT